AAGTTGGVNRLEAVHRQIARFILPGHVSLSELVNGDSLPSVETLAAEKGRVNQAVAGGVQLADISVGVTVELNAKRARRCWEVLRFGQPGAVCLVVVINGAAAVAQAAMKVLVIAAAEISRIDKRVARRVQPCDESVVLFSFPKDARH